jgi:tetratricopeptide (TPR) repeat protein
MIRKVLLITILFQINISIFGQIFIPIFLNSPEVYYCKPQNDKAVAYYERAQDFYETNINISIDYLEGAIKLDSLFCDAYYSLIVAYAQVHDYKNSMKYVNLALKSNSLNPWLIKTKGLLLLKSGKFEKAVEYYNNLIGQQPRNPLWYYYCAESLIELNQLESAKINAIKMETIINQNYNTDLKVLSYYLQGKIAFLNEDFTKALQAFSLIKSDFKRSADFCYYYGMTYLKKNDKKNAKKYIKKSIKLGYEDVENEVKEMLDL